MTAFLATATQSPAQGVTIALALSAALFTVGLIGFLVRRNMILMFLCTELMLQAASIAFIAFGRMRGDTGGQVFVIFILTVAAAEAGPALGPGGLLYRPRATRSAEAWQELHE